MAAAEGPPARIQRLAEYVFDGMATDPLAGETVAWLSGSARFRDFLEAHRDKVRKKLRSARDAESRRDIRTELQAAHLLLADRRMEVAFEAYGSARGGPDFTVSFREGVTFNLEVTRLRRPPDAIAVGASLLVKLRQLPPGSPNVVVMASDAADARSVDIAAAVRTVRGRADAKQEALFVSRGYDGSRGFYDRLLRLGAIVAWCEMGGVADARAAAWVNGSARIPVPQRALRACLACLSAAGS